MAGIRELRKQLIRGARVTVRPTTDQADLQGKKVYVKSKGLVPCKRDGRCAEDRRCNKHAVFVSVEDPATLDDGAGWRKGAYKLCLTHLNDEKNKPLTAERKRSSSKPKTPRRKTAKAEIVDPEDFRSGAESSEPTWVELAHAASAATTLRRKDIEKLVSMARGLKAANEQYKSKLLDAQEQLLNVQRMALSQMMDQAPAFTSTDKSVAAVITETVAESAAEAQTEPTGV